MSYGFLNKQGAASAGSSSADTPIVCETCLGPNPYVRMSKHHLGKECKICGRPYTVFRWNPGNGMRFKHTEICTTCAKLRHVCQSCILDLDYHLPAQVRDAALGSSVKIPMSDINRQYFVNRMDSLLDGASPEATRELVGPSRAGHEVLKKLVHARSDSPWQQQQHLRHHDRPPVCSFYARGACTRGQACPYRHEGAQHAVSTNTMTGSSASSESQRPSRSASSMPLIEKVPGAKALEAPSDAHIRTLFFVNLPVDMDQDQLRTVLLTSIPKLDQCNAIAHIQMIMSSHCAFVHFETRDNAECAADALATKVYMQGQHQVRVAWGRRPPSSAS